MLSGMNDGPTGSLHISRLAQPGCKPFLNNRILRLKRHRRGHGPSQGLPKLEGLVEGDERIVATDFQEEKTRPMATNDGLR